ncbi:MAG: DNA translocase FtsK [Patescibacteria group bacterium]
MARPKKNGKNTSSHSHDDGGWLDISQETKNSILGIASFLVAVVAVLSFAGKAGAAGEFINAIARSLFGWGFFIVSVAFVLLGAAFIKSIHRQIALSAVLGTALFTLSSLGILFIVGEGDFATRVAQGGYLGVALGWPLLMLVGFIAALIILVGLLIVSLLLSLNVPIHGLLPQKEEENKKEMEDKPVSIKPLVTNPAPVSVAQSSMQPNANALKAKQAREERMEEFVIKNVKLGTWKLPPLDLMNEDQNDASSGDINANAMIIRRTLAHFGIDVEMGEVSIGPTVTQYTLRPAVGVKLSRISALHPDLSLALAAHPIRIEAPIPGKSLIGIEVPNKKTAILGLKSMFEHDEFTKSKYFLPIAIGRDVSGNPIYAGLEKMPHLLVAGATGSGKSVVINSILMSLLYKHSPDVLKLILVDPKRVELSLYNNIPHLITPVITDTKKVMGALKWAVNEMDRRYELLSKAATRDILTYNAKMAEKKEPFMPMLVIVIDEMADLMATYGRDVETAIVRLAQMSRAVGIHLILSTQRPSVEVITGLIKANITSRIALQVASQIDSRTILDMAGAERLLGKGDMLFVSNESSKPRRVQGPNVTENEVKEVVSFLAAQGEKLAGELADTNIQVDFENASGSNGHGGYGSDNVDDDKYEDAKRMVIEMGKASASLLQRRLGLGYARAARLLDILEEKGIIGPGDGAKPREVYIKPGEIGGRPDASLAATSIPQHYGVTGVNADSKEAENEEV